MLKSIEIIGFKSFGKKATISIDAPITAIVGPNGSGKSNVVESIRFVLGEQSIKSLRGKGSTDLLFKGSKMVSPANRLKVELCFDNKNRVLKLGNDVGKSVSIDFDTVFVSRELYADGRSVYGIQNTEVRLKDITELLASVHIGTSGHHIISQGEADKLLSASPKERRSMIDDALGLRVYEQRIRDSERKLEKTRLHIAETESIRRELAPHLNFLRKQVEKLNEAEEARLELSRRFAVYESSVSAIFDTRKKENELKIFEIDSKLKLLPDSTLENKDSINEYSADIIHTQESLARIKGEKDTLLRNRESLERSLGKTEGLIEALSRKKEPKQNTEEFVKINKNELVDLYKEIEKEIRSIESNDNSSGLNFALGIIHSIKNRITNFYTKYIQNDTPIYDDTPDNTEELEKTRLLEQNIKESISANIESVKLLSQDEELHYQTLTQLELKLREQEATVYKTQVERNKLLSEREIVFSDIERVLSDEIVFKEEKKSFEPFLLPLAGQMDTPVSLAKDVLASERRVLERIRVKLEDIGGGSGSDILKEYEDTKERDEYLRKELVDLESSIVSLRNLIGDLRDVVREEFKKGIDKINVRFSEFFSAMFGGGHAFISFVAEYKKQDDDTENEQEETDFVPKFERGVEVHVELPNKKVRDLSMLSGGERSLVSIALLFAMSQVNPPPFLVLDETDAALDEANSRRYGDMLERLSSETQLVVVTHNRETMSRAGSIYGVTMGVGDSVSRLLSIEFTEAEKIAK